MDMTGLQTLDEVIDKLKKRHVRIMICEANHRVRTKLWKVGILDSINPEDYADKFSTLLKHAGTIALFGGALSRHVPLSEHAANVLKVSSRYLRGEHSDRE